MSGALFLPVEKTPSLNTHNAHGMGAELGKLFLQQCQINQGQSQRKLGKDTEHRKREKELKNTFTSFFFNVVFMEPGS